MTGFETLPGDPELVLETAGQLAATGEQLGGVRDLLLRLSTAEWDSSAGRAFGRRLDAAPLVLAAVSRRYGEAALALRAYAVELDAAQRLSRDAAWRRASALDAIVAVERQRASTPDEVQRRHLDALRDEHRASMVRAEQSWGTATTRFMVADARCAATLAALADDEIEDSWQYHWSHIASTSLGTASVLGGVPNPWYGITAPLSVVAGALQTGVDIGIKIVYDEGSWKEIGVGLALSATAAGAGVLKAGARAGAPFIGPVRGLTAGERLSIGARERLWTNPPWRIRSASGQDVVRRLPLPGPRHAAEPTSLGGRAAQRARAGLDAAVERRILDDLRVATRNGPQALAFLGGSWTLEGGTKAVARARQVQAMQQDRTDH